MQLSLRTFLERQRQAPLEGAEPNWFERGAAAHRKQEYLAALKAWKTASTKGDVEAPYRIGLLYACGEGVVQSVPDAVIWYRQAAEAGHIDAQYQLGLIYLNGAVPGPLGPGTWFQAASQHNSEAAQRTLKILFPNGIAVEKDLKEAMRWMGAAAAGGKVDAQAILGEMYRRGLGCAQDYAEAARWYWLAAEQGVASAQFAMGDIYYQALGVEVDHQAAAAWYERAAKNGDARAQVALASMCLVGEGRPADLDEAGRLFVQAAEQGEARGLYQAALMHLKGEGLPENIDRAETYLRRSAKQNYLPAIIKLAEFYAHGRGIEPDLREAAAWHSQAAALGDVQSQFIIGRLYATGTGVPVNLRELARWFLRAAEQGHATAAHNIAVYYANGTGVERDLAQAIDWYTRAAEEGITTSQVQLGKLYSAGEGVPRDLEKATLWLRKAAESGDPEGKMALAMLHLQGEEGVCDTSRAEELLKQAAEGGHAAAATQLGHLYSGKYTVKYTVEAKAGDAVRWYTKAAEAGNIEAQHTLGMLYLNGRGVGKNLTAAANWLEKAAHGDHAPSQFQLAVMFCTAQGVPRDLTQAVSWYEQAAQHGHPLAQYNLAVMLSKGQGCETDEARATSWFQKAAEQGLAEAKRALADLPRAGRLPLPRDEITERSLDQNVSAEATPSHTRNPQRPDQPPTGPSSETTSNDVRRSASRPAAQAPADLVQSKREPPEQRDAASPELVKQHPTQHGSNLSPESTHRDRDQRDHRPEGRFANVTPTREPSNTIESPHSGLRPAAQSANDGVPSSLANADPEPRVRGDKSHLGLTPATDVVIVNLEGQQTSLDSRTGAPSASKANSPTNEQDELSPTALSSPSSSELAGHQQRVRHKQDERLPPRPDDDPMLGIDLPAQMLAQSGASRLPDADLPERQRVANQVGEISSSGLAATPAERVTSARDTPSLEKALQILFRLRLQLLSMGNRKRPARSTPLPNQPHDVSDQSAPSGNAEVQPQPLSAIGDTPAPQTLARQSENATPTRPRLPEFVRKRSDRADHWGSSKLLAARSAPILVKEVVKDIAQAIVEFGKVPREPNGSTRHATNSKTRPSAGGGRVSAGIKPSSASGPSKTILQRMLRSGPLSLPGNALLHQWSRPDASPHGKISARDGAVRTGSVPATPVETGLVGQKHALFQATTDRSRSSSSKRRFLALAIGAGVATIVWVSVLAARIPMLPSIANNHSRSNSSKRRFLALAIGAGVATIVWVGVMATQIPMPPSIAKLVPIDSREISNGDQREINKTNDRAEVDSDMGLKSKNTNFLSTNGNYAPRSIERPSDQRGASIEMPPAIESKPFRTPVDSVNRTETRFTVPDDGGDEASIEAKIPTPTPAEVKPPTSADFAVPVLQAAPDLRARH